MKFERVETVASGVAIGGCGGGGGMVVRFKSEHTQHVNSLAESTPSQPTIHDWDYL